MARLLWSPRAVADVHRLHRFLARHDVAAAARAIEAIRAGARKLRQHPNMGRPADDLPAEFREFVVPFGSSAYIVMYRVQPGQVAILAIRHAREAGYP